MEDQNLLKFIAEKRKLADEGFSFSYVYESSYLKELAENYEKRRTGLEKQLNDEEGYNADKVGKFLMIAHVQKKFEEPLQGVKMIHIGTEAGFSRESIALIAIQSTDEKPSAHSQSFLETMRKILGNSKMIPDNTVLLLTSEPHHTMAAASNRYKLSENVINNKDKLREKAAKRRGQKAITTFFKSVKNQPIESKPKMSSKSLYKVEEMAMMLRGDKVKILWLPKKHYELNPSNYVSVFLHDEINRKLFDNQEIDLITGCDTSIDLLPNAVWKYAVDHANNCEEFYRDYKKAAVILNNPLNPQEEGEGSGAEQVQPDDPEAEVQPAMLEEPVEVKTEVIDESQ
jgi:hypothetical protein